MTYEPAEKPLDEWTKAAIEKEIEAMTGESEEKVKAVLKPYTLDYLHSSLLTPCPWSRASSYIVEDLGALEDIEDWLSEDRNEDYLARATKEMGDYLRLEEKYNGKMPLDKAALKAIWDYAERSLREHAERQGFSWLVDNCENIEDIVEHEAEIDALNWVPADRLRMLRIMNLPDDATED